MAVNILVGDIGSTKSTWWSNSEGNKVFSLSGYNPMSHLPGVGKKLFEQLWHVTEGDAFDHIWYYGAGVINQSVTDQVNSVMAPFFPKATLHISSDLQGACIAVAGDTPASIAILGTGSHAAVWDGHQIVRQASSLGFPLGDEGGGSNIGKEMVRAFFYGEMPEEIAMEMKLKISTDRRAFLQDFYNSETPNQFLADFVRHLSHFHGHPWLQQIVISCFRQFVIRHLLPLKVSGPIHVVGSTGTIFADLCRQVLEEHHLQAGTFLQDPARRLFEIHLTHD